MPRLQIEVAKREHQEDPDPLVVEYLGAEFTCRSDLNQFTLLDMLSQDANDLGAVMSAFMAFLREIFVPEDWDRFRTVCREHRADVEDLQPLIEGVVGYYTARPTKRPSDLSGGRSPTTTPLRAGSWPMAVTPAG